jgi:hypothetical protein
MSVGRDVAFRYLHFPTSPISPPPSKEEIPSNPKVQEVAHRSIPQISPTESPKSPLTVNQQWQKLMDKVMEKVKSFVALLKVLKGFVYDFEAQLNKIREAQKQGKKICLFVGRCPLENLPSDKKGKAGENGEPDEKREANEDEFWVSGDLLIRPQCKPPEIAESRIGERNFLWLDFNQDGFLDLLVREKISFDKIVVDLSTTKGLLNFFPKRFKSILKDENSEIICERFGYGQFSLQQEKPKLLDKAYFIPYSDYEDHLNSLIEQGLEEDTAWKQTILWMDQLAVEVIIQKLNEDYTSVELKQNAPFPYSSTMNPDNKNEEHFVLKGKKS